MSGLSGYVTREYHKKELAYYKAFVERLVPAAHRVRGAWLRGGAATEDMKAACNLIDMALAELKTKPWKKKPGPKSGKRKSQQGKLKDG